MSILNSLCGTSLTLPSTSLYVWYFHSIVLILLLLVVSPYKWYLSLGSCNPSIYLLWVLPVIFHRIFCYLYVTQRGSYVYLLIPFHN